MLIPFVLFFLLFVGLFLAAWITNALFEYFRKDQYTLFDSLGTLFLFSSLFATYAYYMAAWLH